MNPVSPLPRIAPLSILCADDNLLLGEVMVKVLQRAGHRAEHVGDGLTAWDHISRDLTAYNVIVTDHQMPALNGIELVVLLRDAGYAGHIVVHSSCLTDELRAGYRQLGVTTFVTKTCKLESLLAAIHGARKIT